jgi:tetratricopeptide (TPR) repeat protein
MKIIKKHSILCLIGYLVLVFLVTSCGKAAEEKEKAEGVGQQESVQANKEKKPETIGKKEEGPKDFLSLSWVREKINIVDGLSGEEKRKRTVSATTSYDEGRALYQKAEYVEAAKSYERALDDYPTAAAYFGYANALYMIPRHTDSIRAFKISIELGYEQSHYAYYNIACLYSLTSESRNAFEYLEKAVEAGFKDFDHIGRDPDLEYLRSQSDWEERFVRLQGSDDAENYRAMISGKTIRLAVRSTVIMYVFCENGKAELSGTSNVTQYGTWKVDGSRVVISWTRADSLEGVGEPEAVSASGPSYKEYKRVAHAIDKQETIDLANLEEHFKDRGFPEILDRAGDCTPKD